MPIHTSIGHYKLQRERDFFVGSFCIPVTSLVIIPSLQRPFDEDHMKKIGPMYTSDGIDNRVPQILECVVLQDHKEQVEEWVKNHPPGPAGLNTADFERLELPEVTFPIIKGQHRYKAYQNALELNLIPDDAPHRDCLCVKLYYEGVPGSHTL